jgi:hypothetical protein
MSNELHTTDVFGHTVRYDDSARPGIDYLLYDLAEEEARVFFEYAERHGKADFEDDEDRNYSLVKSNDGTYILIRRE